MPTEYEFEYRGYTVSVGENPDQYRGGFEYTISQNDTIVVTAIEYEQGYCDREAMALIDLIWETRHDH